jgi:uncharacterized protein (TIGR03435 family)
MSMRRCGAKQLLIALTAGLAILAAAALSLRSQPPLAAASEAAAFEVASVRKHVLKPGVAVFRMGSSDFGRMISGNRFTEELATLTDLLKDAYDVKDYQISGAPDWAAPRGGEYYDIVAKAEGDGTPTTDQVRLMLQALLADRFQLKLHREAKEVPVYDLVAGKGGPKLKEVAANAPFNRSGQTLTPGILAMRTTIPLFIQLISSQVDRPVIDQTALAGTYDYNWPQPSAMGDASIFTVVQEQLGLSLKPDKARIEMLAIEHVEKPSEN